MNPEAHALLHELLPDLYRSFLRAQLPCYDEIDLEVLAVLGNYALWTGRSEWLYSLAAGMVQSGVRSINATGRALLELVCLVAALQGQTVLAEYYYRLVPGKSVYFDYCAHRVLRGHAPPVHSASEHPDTGHPSVKRLLIFDAAITGDMETENYVYRRMSKNPPVDAHDLLDLYATFMCRGKLFRAQRLLLRHSRMYGERPELLDQVLQTYLINGKHLLYLRRLARMEHSAYRRNWFEFVYCIYSLGLGDRRDELLAEVFAESHKTPTPSYENQLNFLRALDAAGRSPRPPLYSGECEYLVQGYYLSRTDMSPELIQERYQYYRRQIEMDTGDEQIDPQLLNFYFRLLFRNVRLYAGELSSPQLFACLEGLAGSNAFIRVYLGLYAYNREWRREADRYLYNRPGNLPDLLHARADLAVMRADYATALRIYSKLVRSYPESTTMRFNLAMVLEKAGRIRQALETYNRILELDPGMLEARDRINILRQGGDAQPG
ncbi:MAG: tetratricopeptide repeat protein [Leptospiraceae bacterium]|nr:tetratricopeptide repeat protein [Leptospiraceae bacterium]